jgi:hypothetical protein
VEGINPEDINAEICKHSFFTGDQTAYCVSDCQDHSDNDYSPQGRLDESSSSNGNSSDSGHSNQIITNK